MKKNFANAAIALISLLPVLSFANGVECSITSPLYPVVYTGGTTTFQAVCSNNTHNRNYTDFRPLIPVSNVTVTTSCNGYLPVHGSCVLNGTFTPTGTDNGSFYLGLHYGGTDYPKYNTLEFSTTVKRLVFTKTLGGPDGGDVVAAVQVPASGSSSSMGSFYALVSNLDQGISDIYYFDGSTAKWTNTNFPLPTTPGTTLLPSSIMTADSTGILYLAVQTGPDATKDVTQIWKYGPTGKVKTWTQTNFSTTGYIVSLAVSAKSVPYAVVQNGASTDMYVGDSSVITNWNPIPTTPTDLQPYYPNGKKTYLTSDNQGNMYAIVLDGMTYDVYIYNAGTLSWSSTNFASSATGYIPDNIATSTNSIIVSGYVPATPPGYTYDAFVLSNNNTWSYACMSPLVSNITSTSPPTPSMLVDGSGNLYIVAYGSSFEVYYCKTPPQTSAYTPLNYPTLTGGTENVLLQSLSPNAGTAEHLYTTTTASGFTDVYISENMSPITTTAWPPTNNFPSYNVSTPLLLTTLDPTATFPEVLYLQTNGLYEETINIGNWSELNGDLRGLTTRYAINTAGSLFTLNGRQNSAPTCTGVPGYDSNWSNLSQHEGFIDVSQYPGSGTWSDTTFPSAMNDNFVIPPLMTHNTNLYGIIYDQASSSTDVWQYNGAWSSTDFALPTLIDSCAQGSLTADSNGNVYVVTFNFMLNRFSVAKYNGSSWTDVNDIWSGSNVISQLTSDNIGNVYAIVNGGVYKYNGMAVINTNFSMGMVNHLQIDPYSNVYAVAKNSTEVYKFSAQTQTWGSSLNFASTGQTIYQQILIDSNGNIYARTANNTIYKYTAATATWSNMNTVAGFPITATINKLNIDSSNLVYLSTSQGLYVYAGFSWTQLRNDNVTDFQLNNGFYYMITNDQGVYKGYLS